MNIEQNHHQPSQTLYDAVEHTVSGAAFYSLYSQDGHYRVELLVLEDGRICDGERYQVNDDGHIYPAALAGDHHHSFAPAELETRVAALTAVLEATAPEQRTTLSRDQPVRNVSRAGRFHSREISRGRTR